MASHPPIVVVSRGGEHEAVLLGTSILVGVGMLTAVPAPASVLSLLPSWVVTAWAVAWAVSGVVGLAGLWWRRDVHQALMLELAALVINTAAVLLYVASAFVVSGWRAWAAGLFLAGWSLANIVRSMRIRSELKALVQR